jgi:hypothetical protein
VRYHSLDGIVSDASFGGEREGSVGDAVVPVGEWIGSGV